MTALILFFCMLVSLCFLLYADYESLQQMIVIMKTVSSILFILTGYFAAKEQNRIKLSTYSRFILTGLLFSLGGDVFLGLDTSQGTLFIIGVAFFALGHVAYTAGFFQYRGIEKLNIIWTLTLFTPLFLLITFTDWFYFDGLYPLVVFYALLITFMVSKSFSLWKLRWHSKAAVYKTIIGALLFLISDTVLLFALFLKTPPRHLDMVNHLIYYIGQGILALSLRKEIIKSNS